MNICSKQSNFKLVIPEYQLWWEEGWGRHQRRKVAFVRLLPDLPPTSGKLVVRCQKQCFARMTEKVQMMVTLVETNLRDYYLVQKGANKFGHV